MEGQEQELIISLQSQLSLFENNEEQKQEHEKEEEKISLENRVKQIFDITGYDFKDAILLQQAFTHHSYDDNFCESYERLEYMGDSVLNMLVAKDHYLMYPDLDPGKLTRLRASNVDTEKLARAALKHGLYKLMRHNLPMLSGKVKDFKDAMEEYPVHSSGLIDAPKVLADIVESLIGAIFLDSNSSMDTTWKVIKSLLQPIITPTNFTMHPVTMLYEICQKNGFQVKIRDLWKEQGEIEILVDGEFVGRGKYSGKRSIAYNRAAQNAYESILRKLSVDLSEFHDDYDES